MIFYGGTNSGHSFKVLSFLLLTQQAHEFRCIDLAMPRNERGADFIKHSKFGEVPVLVDDGRALCQSNSILMYIAKKIGQLCGAPDEWTRVTEWLSWEANRVGFSVPNLRYALLWSEQRPDVLRYLRARVLADLATLDGVLATSQFLVPSGLTIADLSCAAYLYWLHQAGVSIDDYPHVRRWLSDMAQMDGWVHPDVALLEPAKNQSLP